MSQVLTNSRLKASRACARMHQYRYLDCRVPVGESGPARFGTLFHAGLETWWKAYAEDPLERVRLSLEALAHHVTADEEELVIAEELLGGYHLRWHEEPLETLLVEDQFIMPLVNPTTNHPSRTWVLSGKIDALVNSQIDQRHYLVEHKTTSQDIGEGSTYWQRLRMDGQVNVYYDAYKDVAGCIYDVIRRPGQRRLKATPEGSRKYTGKGQLYSTQRDQDESLDDFRLRIREAIAAEPENYYKRGVVVRLEREIFEHRVDLWLQASQMRDAMALGMHPRNPDACVQFNRTCDYFDVCTGVASIEDERLFKIREQHPELNLEVTT